MNLSYSDIRRFDDKLDLMISSLAQIRADQVTMMVDLNVVRTQGASIMATVAELKAQLDQNTADLRNIGQQYLDFILAKDGLIAELNAALAARDATINGLLERVAAGEVSLADARAEIAAATAAFEAAVVDTQATEDVLRAGLPGVPPVGGSPLNLSYLDAASFSAAVAAYTGPEAVTLDGVEVKAGPLPSLDYFTHSATGEVNTTGPTD